MCAVTVDGRALLTSAGHDGTVRLWDPTTGHQERELTGHTDWVNGCARSPWTAGRCSPPPATTAR